MHTFTLLSKRTAATSNSMIKASSASNCGTNPSIALSRWIQNQGPTASYFIDKHGIAKTVLLSQGATACSGRSGYPRIIRAPLTAHFTFGLLFLNTFGSLSLTYRWHVEITLCKDARITTLSQTNPKDIFHELSLAC